MHRDRLPGRCYRYDGCIRLYHGIHFQRQLKCGRGLQAGQRATEVRNHGTNGVSPTLTYPCDQHQSRYEYFVPSISTKSVPPTTISQNKPKRVFLRSVVKDGLHASAQGETISDSRDEGGEVEEGRDAMEDAKLLVQGTHLLRVVAGGVPLLAITFACGRSCQRCKNTRVAR